MKRILLLIPFISIILLSGNLFSQVLLDENFNYTAGDSLGAHGWVSFSGGSTNVLTVTSPGLVYSGYPLSGIGNATTVRSFGQDAYKQFSADSTGSVYAAFMVKIDSGRTGDYFLAFLPSTSTTNYTARVYAKDSAGSISFGLSKSSSSSGPIVYSAFSYLPNVTYLLVVKYTFNTGSSTDDEMRLYVFSSGVPGSEPGTPTVGPVTGTISDAPNLSRIALRQGSSSSSPTLMLDGIRVFKSWSNIVSVKQINSIADEFSLKQNYPNPFNPSTKIEFSLKSTSVVTLVVYDAVGRVVRTLIDDESITYGTHQVNFISENLSSGIYFYKLTARSNSSEVYNFSRKMNLVK